MECLDSRCVVIAILLRAASHPGASRTTRGARAIGTNTIVAGEGRVGAVDGCVRHCVIAKVAGARAKGARSAQDPNVSAVGRALARVA